MMRLTFAVLLFMPVLASADIVTEFGVGYKLPSTSVVLRPECAQAYVPVVGGMRSCGGDNPAFIGWPVAWESEWKGRFRVRAGWFHYSNWFDGGNYLNGGDDFETHMDLAAVTVTVRWRR